jgi:hypothetical protein
MTRLTASLAQPNRSGRVTATAPARQSARPSSLMVQVPTGGLDAISPVEKMPPQNAIQLDNMFPQPGYIELRRGFGVHANTTNPTLPVESVMAYNADVAVDDKLFAAVGANIYDVTTASVPAAVVTGLTNARWQHVNFATTGGQFLYLVNGVDSPRYWDGITWAIPAITGVTAADLIHVASYSARLWFVERDSLNAWYLNLDSIQGPATKFPLGAILDQGGYLVAIGTWSLDGGDGPDDRIAFVSSRGQVAIYTGTDPNDSQSFTKLGVYHMGAPIGRRCLLKVGADLMMISIDGILPLSQALSLDRASMLRAAITANIQPILNALARQSADQFGWQLISYPRGTRAVFNVPSLENESQLQYIMNTVTGAWCRFIGMEANCWELFKERLFFGGNDGVVYEADDGADDNGEAISADVKTAFTIGDYDGLKHFIMARPFLTTDGEVSPGLAVNVDYRDDAQVDTDTATLDDVALWDIALWDVDIWPPEERLVADWRSIAAQLGTSVSVRFRVSALGSGQGDIILQLKSIQLLYTTGGIL